MTREARVWTWILGALCAAASAKSATAAGLMPRWGFETSLGADLSRYQNGFLDPQRKWPPPSGAVSGTLRWRLGRVSLVSGAGYEQRVHADGYTIRLVLTSGPDVEEHILTFTQLRRFRSSVLPVAIETRLWKSWTVSAGGEWRHLFHAAERFHDTRVDGKPLDFPDPLSNWQDQPNLYRREQYAATAAVAHTWVRPAGVWSLTGRWVEGLQELLPHALDAHLRHRSIALVLGWHR